MSWFSSNLSIGNLDLAGAVNKLSESVKSIEKNFDTALGFEEKAESDSSEASRLWPSSTERKALFEPVMAFMSHKGEESTTESPQQPESSKHPSSVEEKEGVEIDTSAHSALDKSVADEGENREFEMGKDNAEIINSEISDRTENAILEPGKAESASQPLHVDSDEVVIQNNETRDSSNEARGLEKSLSAEPNSETNKVDQVEDSAHLSDRLLNIINLSEHRDEELVKEEFDHEASPVKAVNVGAEVFPIKVEVSSDLQPGTGSDYPGLSSSVNEKNEGFNQSTLIPPSGGASEMISEADSHENVLIVDEVQDNKYKTDTKERFARSGNNVSDSGDSVVDMENVKREMKMMETALQGAARQAQAKADEIAKLLNENEHLKGVIEDLKRKSNEAEIESLRDEYHQRVAALERKVYALTKERDTLRREQSKKSDAAALLKEKDEIINQVMAEGEELSKKQAAQESQIRKLRAQIRELEEEKKGLIAKLQGEENKVESIKKDKTATEKLLQETIEKHQAELATQKEYYTNALNAAKEAEVQAEERANHEARTALESPLREAEEREAMLIQALEELRQTLSRTEQQAVFKEDMLRREIEDLQKRYQASERRCEELITQVPDSTRPLLRQIEAMQENTARRAEAWAAVERTLNSRLQEAEAKAAAAEERQRSVNERLSQTLSRINVLEAQISCLRAEQTQLSRSLEKERQRAAENRQEYLVAKEDADTQEGRAKQLEEEIRELRKKHKQELQDALSHRERLEQEIQLEKTARLDLERTTRLHSATVPDQTSLSRHNSAFENGNLTRKLSNASSLSSMEESVFLQASLDSSDNFSEKRNTGETTISPYYLRSMTPSAFEATLRQKEGEIASYMSRLASMEAIRDSLAEELVKMTEQCEKLRAETAMLPGLRAELEAIRRRHSSALELMGERDEELEELRADIVDLKEMYREQVNLLVNKIQILSSSIGTT